MRDYNRNKISCLILLSIVLVGTISLCPTINSSLQPFFTLRAITTGGFVVDYYNSISRQLNRIGIDLDIDVMDWSNFIDQLIFERNFDLLYFGLAGGGNDPDFTGIYDENGSLNLFGYDTSMDWDDDLGTGINEWYMKRGTIIMPPNSQERIQHYWDWEEYLMDKICPMLPLFNYNNYEAYWSKLSGYNQTKGIIQSWGNLFWTSNHTGQNSIDELVISDAPWSNLNPLFQDDLSSSFISNAIMDPLIWIDYDKSVWPHLAKSFTFINDTTLEIVARDGIKWADDIEGNFTNEYFDIRDVYFTLYAWKYVSNDVHMWDWIEAMEIVDQYTIRIYIDGDNTTPANEPFAPSLSLLATNILPEHYLNQSQLIDGKTPDKNHIAWTIFNTQPFGTSLFSLKDYTPNLETILAIRDDCWLINKSITNDSSLNWSIRFGNFTDIINQLRIRVIPDIQLAKNEFLDGYIDIFSINLFPELREQLSDNINFTIQSVPQNSMNFLGFNMRERRGPMGSRELCPSDESMTKGLAIRKAICYAIDRTKINDQLNDGEYRIIHWPIYERLGIWCNPNIIRYNYDLFKACELMEKAGYDIPGFYTPGFGTSTTLGSEFISIGFLSIIVVGVIYLKKKSRNT